MNKTREDFCEILVLFSKQKFLAYVHHRASNLVLTFLSYLHMKKEYAPGEY